MPYQQLGRSGLIVSRLSFGSWVTFKNQVGASTAYELMKLAYEAGINFFDNAEAYAAGEAEVLMGEAVRQGVADKVWTREAILLSTKIFFGTAGAGPNAKGLSRKHIVEGTRASLARLGLSYVDLLYCHRPDPVTPIEETVRAMAWCIDQGYALYWGTSEWSAAQIAEAVGTADRLGLPRPIMEQPEYNIFARQRVEVEYAPLYALSGLGLTTWSPLATGVLTGKYTGKAVPPGSRLSLESYAFLLTAKFGNDAWQIDAADALKPIADGLGCSLAQLSIAWCLKNPHVSTVILGATSAAQLQENLGALAVVDKLTPEVMAAVAGVAERGKPTFSKVEAQVHGIRGTDKLSGFVRPV